jgi:hypothetical protein
MSRSRRRSTRSSPTRSESQRNLSRDGNRIDSPQLDRRFASSRRVSDACIRPGSPITRNLRRLEPCRVRRDRALGWLVPAAYRTAMNRRTPQVLRDDFESGTGTVRQAVLAVRFVARVPSAVAGMRPRRRADRVGRAWSREALGRLERQSRFDDAAGIRPVASALLLSAGSATA